MGIILGRLSLDEIADSDIRDGNADRAVNADSVELDVETWRRTYDGVAVVFLLTGIYRATAAALLHGEAGDFFCLDDPDGGRIAPAGPGRIRVSLKNGEEHELSGFDVLRATNLALLDVAEFLTASGVADGASTLLGELAPRGR